MKMRSISITLFLIILITISCLSGNTYSQDPSVSPPLGGVVPLETPKNDAVSAEGRLNSVVTVASAGFVAAIIALF